MSAKSLRDLVRKVLSGGLAMGGVAHVLPAALPPTVPVDDILTNSSVAPADATQKEILVRAARPKVLLRALDATRIGLISSHRSHRSHSSHRSHYSGSSTPTPPPSSSPARPASGTTTRAPSPDTSRPNATPTPSTSIRGLIGGASDSAALGDRTLERGMRGKDVEQLIILLVKQRLLRPDQVPNESLFTEEMETVIKKFQAKQSLIPNGRVDFRTLLLLKAQ